MTEKQYFDFIYTQLTPQDKLIHTSALLYRAASNWPSNTALICDDEQITYQELYYNAWLFAQKLKELGVTTQDRVLLFYENSRAFYIAYYGVWLAGAVVAPLNIFLSETEFSHIVQDATPKVVIVSQALTQKLSPQTLASLPPLLSNNDIPFSQELPDQVPPYQEIAYDPDSMVALLYTSGTTGFPKGVMLSSRAIIMNVIQALSRIRSTSGDRVLCPLPLFHCMPQNTCMWTPLIIGATAITVSKLERRLLLAALAHKPTVIVAVPALYGLFALMRTLDLTSVRYFIAGGDALSDKIREGFALVYRRKICNGYGLTETAPFITGEFDDYIQPTNTVGKPFTGIDYVIKDEQGAVLPKYHVGLLWVKGPNLMLGYYNAPEATQAVLKDGWLNTGDLAYIDHQDKIVLSGRERELIVQKGIKIYPQEIENVLLSHPEVTQAAVIGIPDADGETPLALVASRVSDTQALIAELKDICSHNLAAYKVPRQFIVEAELPTNATGKVDKKKLKADYLATH